MTADATLSAVLDEVRGLRAEVVAIRSSLAAKLAPSPPPPRLLSQRQAAKMLGIDRGATLGDLLASGNLRTVTLGGRPRIPLVEVERLAAEGTTRTGRKPHRKTAGAKGDTEVARILALRRPIAA